MCDGRRAPKMAGRITGREAQLAELAAVAGLHEHHEGQSPEPAPPLVVVYGGVSTGKSLCVHHLLSSSAAHFAVVDCTGVMAPREFYREILGQLQRNSRRRRRVVLDEDDNDEGQLQIEKDMDDVVTITDAPQNATGARVLNAKRRQRSDRDDTFEKQNADSDEDDRRSPEPPSSKSRRQQKEDLLVDGGDGAEDAATVEAVHGSLNFLSFLKALRRFMSNELPSESRLDVPTVYVALDHLETLLDRGFERLLTCLLTVNDQLDYLHVFDAGGAPWRLCVILTARAVSLNLDLFLHGVHPAFVHFPAYTKDEIACIVAQNVLCIADSESPSFLTLNESRERSSWLRKWLVSMYELLPHCHNDWLEFQHIVVQMLPSFNAFFDVVSTDEHATLPQMAYVTVSSSETNGKARSWKQLQFRSRECVAMLEKSRRRHLFGYDCVASNPVGVDVSASSTAVSVAPVTSGDPVAFIASSKLSRNCLLLLVACYLASFTPHEADAHFVSSSCGTKRKRRMMRTSDTNGSNGTPETAGNGKRKTSTTTARKAMNQQLIGPKIFELPRLMAIYASLLVESDAAVASPDEGEPVVWNVGSISQEERSTRTRADIFTHLSLLIRLRLLQRASPPSDLDQPLFRCIADTRLVEEIARRLQFPLHSYLTTRA